MPVRAQCFLTCKTLQQEKLETQVIQKRIQTFQTKIRTFETQNQLKSFHGEFVKEDRIEEKSIFPILVTSLTISYKSKVFTSSRDYLFLLDSASDGCYVTRQALATIPSHMYLHSGAVRMALEVLGSTTEMGFDQVAIKLRLGTGDWFEVTFLVVDKISESAPFSCTHVEQEIGRIKSYHKKHYEKVLGQINHFCYLPNRGVDFLFSTKLHDKLTANKQLGLYPFLPDVSLTICPVGPKGNIFSGAVKVKNCKCDLDKNFKISLQQLRNRTAAFYAKDLAGNASRLEARLLELFRVENIDAQHNLSSDLRLEDRIFLETISNSCVFLPKEKRYEIKLPFLSGGGQSPVIFNNYIAARDRFLSTERRLMNGLKTGLFKKEAITKIDDSLLEHIRSGRYVELEDQDERVRSDPEEVCNYLPLRLVFNPKSTSTPIRTTLDASSPSGSKIKGFGPSLNSCLAAGLCTLPQQTSCHIGFRRHEWAFGLDLSRFFLSINIHPDHQKFQRFCFRPFGSKGPIKCYQIRSVCWGLNSSPASCSMVLKKHCLLMVENAKKPHHKSKEFKAAVDSLTDGKSIYADNILQSVETLELCIQRIEYLEEIFEAGGFVSGKYFATDPRILKNLPPEKRCQDNLILFTSSDGSQDWMCGSARLLGETFNFKSDMYTFGGFEDIYQRYSEVVSISKRDLASCMARVAFGHINYRAPYVLLIKALLMQVAMAEAEELEALKADEKKPSVSTLWGRDLSPKFLQDFKSWVHFLPELEKLNLPRFLPCLEKPFPAKIITFVDAGSYSCCSVTYCVSYHPREKERYSGFVQSRVRTKPLSLERMNQKKKFTIPRLEMLALSQGHANTMDICRDFGLDPAKRAIIFSDSLCALAWCATDQRNLSLWHLNKARPIQDSKIPLRFCISQLNSADFGTKVVSPDCLNSSLWRHGPGFLLQEEKDWPKMDPGERKLDRKSAVYLDGLVKNAVEVSFFMKTYHTKSVEIDLQEAHPYPQRTWANFESTSFAVLEWMFETSSFFFTILRRLGHYLFIYYNLKSHAARVRFKTKLKREPSPKDIRKEPTLKPCTLQEAYKEARLMFFFWHQRDCFRHEMKVLLKQYNKNIPLQHGRIDAKSRLYNLNPKLHFLGRASYPIILSEGRATGPKVLLDPGNLDVKKVRFDKVTQRVCKDFVRQLHISDMAKTHLTKNDLVNRIREQKVHILRQNQVAVYITSVCGGCARHHSRAINQVMSQLPREMSEPAVNRHGQLAVQRHLVIDHCGEFKISTGNPFQRRITRANHGTTTVHILLIICMVSGHLSLYIVPSVSAAWTALALKNHSNAYLNPWKVFLDNASGFKNLGDSFRHYFADPENQWKLESEFCRSPTHIEFVFGKPLFSAGQGRVERAVQSLKKGLRSIHAHQLFSYHSLQMALSDIQAIVNTRPICQIREFRDAEDVHRTILTPKLLVLGQSDTENSGFDLFDAMDSVRKEVKVEEQWRFRRHLAKKFSEMYQKDVLASKEDRTAWQQASSNVDKIKPGTILLFPKQPSESDKELVSTLGGNASATLKGAFHGWPLAQVQQVIRGNDGEVRGVALRLPDQKVEFEWKRNTYVKKIVKPSSILIRSINSCRMLPAYSKLQEYQESLEKSVPKAKKAEPKPKSHPMVLRSVSRNAKTFFGTVNEIPDDKRYRLADGTLERQLHEENNFFKPLFKWTYNPRPKGSLSRKEKIESRKKQQAKSSKRKAM